MVYGVCNYFITFVELEGHQNDAKVKRSLTSLGKKTVRLDALGSYEISQAVQ